MWVCIMTPLKEFSKIPTRSTMSKFIIALFVTVLSFSSFANEVPLDRNYEENIEANIEQNADADLDLSMEVQIEIFEFDMEEDIAEDIAEDTEEDLDDAIEGK